MITSSRLGIDLEPVIEVYPSDTQVTFLLYEASRKRCAPREKR